MLWQRRVHALPGAFAAPLQSAVACLLASPPRGPTRAVCPGGPAGRAEPRPPASLAQGCSQVRASSAGGTQVVVKFLL